MSVVYRKDSGGGMTAVVAHTVGAINRFLFRQKRNYRVAVVRSAANSFLANLTAQYDSIYTTALGAGSVELGTVSSIGTGIGALISTPVGWLMDRYGIRKLYLLGMGLLACAVLIYALAPRWEAIILAAILMAIAMRLMGSGCSVICADSVGNEDRATAQNVCVTIASLLSMLAPLAAAPLVMAFGGLRVRGICPLYGIRFVGYVLVFIFLFIWLREPRRTRPSAAVSETKPDFIEDFRELFRSSRPLKTWIAVSAFTWLPMAMTSPFFQLFAHEQKDADAYVLGAMSTAMILMRLLFGIPLGRLADRIGRKKVIYMLTPLWYASFLLLVFGSGPVMLILAGALQTFYAISSGATSAMTLELVPVEQVGRWSGLLGLFRGLVTIPVPIIAGGIWRTWGPTYVFLIPLLLDLLIRVPLLSLIPETLKPCDSGECDSVKKA